MKLLRLPFLSAFSVASLLFTTATFSTNLLFVSNIQAQSRSFSIQIASVENEPEAQAIAADLKSKGIEAYLVKSEVPGKGTRFRVRIGKFPTMPVAQAAANKLVNAGSISEFAVMSYEPPLTSLIARREAKKPKAAPAAEPQTTQLAAPETNKTETAIPEETKLAAQPIEEARPVETKSEPATAPVKLDPANTKEAAKEEVEKEDVKVETKPETAPESKPEARPETKSEIKTEEKPVEPKPEQPIPQPAIADTGSSAEPKIAAPLLAEVMTEASLSKTNWRMVRRTVETDKNLRAVHFVDSMTGWAAGDAGAVYRTTDSGRTWKPLLSGVSANINFVNFLDWNHGWMIGDSTSKDDDGETVLLSTINGGRTWMIQKIPNLLSVHFSDLQNGWAVGRNATVLRTTNGGNDWKPVEEIQSVIGLPVESSNYNFGFRDVYFLDANHGWLIGNFYGRAQSNIGGLFVTADGGNTWKRLPLTMQTQHVSGRFTPGLLHSVRFTDENTGSVTGEMRDGENRFFFALHTRDGGKTWEQHRTPSRATHSTQFLDPTNGWMAAFAPREGSAEAVVYDTSLMRTDNGGQSWQNDFTAKGSRIRSIFFLSPYKGWAVGDRGMILRYEEKTKAMN